MIMPKFSSKPISEHAEAPLADDGELESIVDHFRRRHADQRVVCSSGGSDVYVVSVAKDARDPRARAAQLAEIVSLVESQGDRVVGREMQTLAEPDPRALFGKGAAREIAARARACDATMLAVDAELSPSQMRNLEDLAGVAIADREAIILNVFLRHAQTKRARIQVEIAQLEYLRPRIRGVGLDMDQQTGGMARARGPGETASELLARKLDGRLKQQKKALQRLTRAAQTQRQGRDDCKRIVLMGYTNAGKTSLMNALTAANLSARDMPFETLDTTSRCLTRHGGDVLVSDTVGFIRRLPERLLASFESTLAEIVEASLLVVVVDASDPERELHVRTTLEVVEKMRAGSVPRFFIWNKIDRLEASLDPEELARVAEGAPHAMLSALDRSAVAELERVLLDVVRCDAEEMVTVVPYERSEVLDLVWGKCRVLESDATNDGLRIRVKGPRAVLARIRGGMERTR
jgi:GTP-binding protein HflX